MSIARFPASPLTTSIGPSFGARVATPELGFLYAHSYRMRADPSPRARDETEMTPTVVLRQGTPVLAIGAAGSERIPAAILQVISRLVDRGQTLEHSVAAPRLVCLSDRVRIHAAFAPEVIGALRQRGFEVELVERGASQHLGLVQAVFYEPTSKVYLGAADPEGDGSAAGPMRGR